LCEGVRTAPAGPLFATREEVTFAPLGIALLSDGEGCDPEYGSDSYGVTDGHNDDDAHRNDHNDGRGNNVDTGLMMSALMTVPGS
jgi:hypothetical protein